MSYISVACIHAVQRLADGHRSRLVYAVLADQIREADPPGLSRHGKRVNSDKDATAQLPSQASRQQSLSA